MSTPDATFLTLHDLSARYPGQPHPALNQVSLTLAAGEIGALIGPSGCGKTTLLRAIAGLEQAETGSIALDGQTISNQRRHIPVEHRKIGMVFQDYALFPHLNVRRNVAFGLHRLAANARRQRVNEVLALVGLHDLDARYPHQLSGGQQQRVALARALAPKPHLLLLDEPFSNLDADLRARLAHEVRGILKAEGTTALFVTHDQLEAFALGDTVGVMHEGHLHQWADAHTLYHRPATRFVAEFIGQASFTPAAIHAIGSTRMIETALGRWPLPEGVIVDGDGPCDLLLRADDLVHDEAAPIKAEVVRRVFRGADFLYTLRLQDGQTVFAQMPSHHDHAPGAWIGIRPNLTHIVTFPSTDTMRSPLFTACALVTCTAGGKAPTQHQCHRRWCRISGQDQTRRQAPGFILSRENQPLAWFWPSPQPPEPAPQFPPAGED